MKIFVHFDKVELLTLKKFLADFKAEWKSREVNQEVPVYHQSLVARIRRSLSDKKYDGTFFFSKKSEVSYLIKVLQYQLIVFHSSSILSGEKELTQQVFDFVTKIAKISTEMAGKVNRLKKMLEG